MAVLCKPTVRVKGFGDDLLIILDQLVRCDEDPVDGQPEDLVITSINGRQDTRVYAKPVKAGRSSHNLSEEETSAIRQALERPREAVTAG